MVAREPVELRRCPKFRRSSEPPPPVQHIDDGRGDGHGEVYPLLELSPAREAEGAAGSLEGKVA